MCYRVVLLTDRLVVVDVAALCTAYPVKTFDGQKAMILATTSWIGGNNAFLSNAFLWFGVCCVLFSLLLAAVHVKYEFQSAISLKFYYRYA